MSKPRKGTKKEVLDDDGTVLIDSWGYYTHEGWKRMRARAPSLRAKMQEKMEIQPLLKAVRSAKRAAK